MHDIKAIRDNPDAFDAGMAKRGLPPQAAAILKIDEERRTLIQELQDAQARRNDASKEIGKAKGQGDNDAAQKLIDEVAGLKADIQAGEDRQRQFDEKLERILAALPNIPLDDVPTGNDETENVEIRRHLEPRRLNFAAQEHFDLGEAGGLMDFETAAKLSGARFVVLRGQLARLERALANFMLDLHTGEFGYTEVVPPMLVRDAAMYGTAQLPKFADDQFKTGAPDDEDAHWLIPTAEVPLTNLAREAIHSADDLPLRYTAFTPCFRKEAGSAGRDTRGMIRMHQFSKVELVSITTPETSNDEHERMTHCAEEVLKRLELPFRTMVLCTGDMGFGARKTYDLEVWLPGQDAYREISSCSQCGDFQARRMNARFRPEGEKSTRYLHTLNGSGLAVGRTLVAVLENYQQADGSVAVPDVLKRYMGGIETLDLGARA
ncbi:serine--tRNA ligase [Pyruvatibacter sp.]|uniref:serine--tRNA ligase n=1 Tax=Pyruvatibacter sp. TaxID=1981328 RepID=UPI0032EACFC6